MRARRSSGTSRCGSTEVNHEPGPRTTASACSIAVSASGQAGGSAGVSQMSWTRPGVVAMRGDWMFDGYDGGVVDKLRGGLLWLADRLDRHEHQQQFGTSDLPPPDTAAKQ